MTKNKKNYLDHTINRIKKEIKEAEEDLDRMVNSNSNRRKDYYQAIIIRSQHILDLQNELNGMETMLDIITDEGGEWE